MDRRKFALLASWGFAWQSKQVGAAFLDPLGITTRVGSDQTRDSLLSSPARQSKTRLDRWKVVQNGNWQWYERETYAEGKWARSGITTPTHLQTGLPYQKHSGYLDESLVPAKFRVRNANSQLDPLRRAKLLANQTKPDPERRARHGRPPSIWLRSLHAEELRAWMRTIEVPEADVEGMTFWNHLVDDHAFDPMHLAGLTQTEQAKLHGIAHFGY